MRILLVHPNYPSQLRALAFSLARNKANEVVFLTNQVNGEIPGVRKLLYKPKRDPSPQTHNYLREYEKAVLQKFPLDPARTHFVGSLPYGEYIKLLQSTTAHVYLTRPFVLSWSLLEAMSCGALVVASDTAPVREVMTDGINGVLVDFFRPDLLAEALDKACDEPRAYDQIREKARATVLAQYDLSSCLNHRLRWLTGLLEKRRRDPGSKP
jgi:glycosyltransferase involved in cell wall biosynthesis